MCDLQAIANDEIDNARIHANRSDIALKMIGHRYSATGRTLAQAYLVSDGICFRSDEDHQSRVYIVSTYLPTHLAHTICCAVMTTILVIKLSLLSLVLNDVPHSSF
jgi:hypothetical protein